MTNWLPQEEAAQLRFAFEPHLPRGTVAAIIRQAGLTRDDFLNLL
jgi:hypothetical protein